MEDERMQRYTWEKREERLQEGGRTEHEQVFSWGTLLLRCKGKKLTPYALFIAHYLRNVSSDLCRCHGDTME